MFSCILHLATKIKNDEDKNAEDVKNRAEMLAPTNLIGKFDCEDTKNLGSRWDDWKTVLNQYFDGYLIREDNRKLQLLFLHGGIKLYKIHATLPVEIDDENITQEYDKAIYRLDKYFKPRQSRVVESFKFGRARQNPNETIDQYITRLRTIAQYCEFDNVDRQIVDKVVQTCYSEELRREFLKQPNIDIQALQDLGRIYDSLEDETRILRGEESYENAVEAVSMNNLSKNYKYTTTNTIKCFKCGGAYPHDSECKAQGKTCNKCGKPNHFAKFCRSTYQKTNRNNERVNNIYARQDMIEDDADKHYIFSVSEMNTDIEVPKIEVKINDISSKMAIDKDASINVIDEIFFSKDIVECTTVPLTPTKEKSTLNNEITPVELPKLDNRCTIEVTNYNHENDVSHIEENKIERFDCEYDPKMDVKDTRIDDKIISDDKHQRMSQEISKSHISDKIDSLEKRQNNNHQNRNSANLSSKIEQKFQEEGRVSRIITRRILTRVSKEKKQLEIYFIERGNIRNDNSQRGLRKVINVKRITQNTKPSETRKITKSFRKRKKIKTSDKASRKEAYHKHF